MNTSPIAHPAFLCSGCHDVEIPAGNDHPILPNGGILCRRCFAKYAGDVQVLAPNRAAAVSILSARGRMTPNPSKKERTK